MNFEWLQGDAYKVYEAVGYLLWETSTEFIAQNGMPSDEEVTKWIECLQARPDSDSDVIQKAIVSCQDYINPPSRYTTV